MKTNAWIDPRAKMPLEGACIEVRTVKGCVYEATFTLPDPPLWHGEVYPTDSGGGAFDWDDIEAWRYLSNVQHRGN